MGRRQPGLLSTMLEREDELAQLEAALAEARSGTGRLWLVGGEPGIGKTTLVTALADAAEPTEVQVCWGRAWEDPGAPAYWPWAQVLRALTVDVDEAILRQQLGPGAADIAQLVPELGRRLGIAAAPGPTSDAQGERFRLFEAVSDLLHAVAANAPHLVILEDVHAADEASLSLLQFVGRHLGRSALLVVGTYRPAEVQASARRLRLVTAVAREGAQLVLSGLGEVSVAELLERTAGVTPAHEVTQEVHQVTEGNPFFVTEIARLLGTKLSVGQRRLPVPEAVQGVIRRRLDGCDEKLSGTLSAAAVLGRDFELAPLARVTGRDAHLLLDDLDEAARHGVVEEAGLNRWTFAHALLRETLYDGLPAADRVRMHRDAAETFENVRPDAVAEVAHHRFEAARAGADVLCAVDACEAAGRQAAAVLAFEQAVHWYGRALEVVDGQAGSERRRYDLHVALGDALLRGGSRVEGRRTYLDAAELARVIGDPELLAQAALGFYGIGEDDLDPDDRSRELLVDEALAALPDEDSALRARLLMSSGNWWDPEVIEPNTRAAVAMARRVGDQATLADVLWNWHYGHSSPSDLEERLPVGDELVELAKESGSREQLILALQWRLSDRFEVADVSGARDDLRVAQREAQALRLPFLLWGVTDMRATVEVLEGRLDAAERTVAKAFVHGTRSTFPLAEVRHAARLITLRWTQGRFEEMAALVRDASQRFPAVQGTPAFVHGIALAELGRLEEARLELERILADGAWSRSGRVPRESSAALLAELCWLLGEPGPAPTLREILQPLAGRHLVNGIMGLSMGAVDRYLGQVATLQGRFDDADAHFEQAHRLHERLGAPWWQARGAVDHARLLLARGRPGDDERAAELLVRARDRFDALGATAHAERAAALLRPTDRTELRLTGEEWTVRYGGAEVRLRDSKGLHYLATLLARPAQHVHALELLGERPALVEAGDERRLRDLQVEIEEARARRDLGRLERAEDEFDHVLARLQAATSTPRAERARQSVTRALKRAIDRISEAHPELGEHLRTTVRTGIYSTYRPDSRTPIAWDI